MAKPNSTAEQQPAAQQAPTTSRSRGPAVNRVILVGRLTADPVLRFTSTGLAVANMRLVTKESR